MNLSFDVYEVTKSWAVETSIPLWAELETGSTNSVAKEDLLIAPSLSKMHETNIAGPALYLTRHQTRGRGRGDHKWSTESGSSLISSWNFAVASVPQPIFSPLAGLALYESLVDIWPHVPFNLKAPNDLFIGTQKTAGLLIETIDRGPTRHTIIGLGLNVKEYPPEVTTATCLADAINELTEHDWRRFLSGFVSRLKLAMSAGLAERIDKPTREKIKDALNLHPHLKEPILDVDELGQLISHSRVVYWHEL